MHFRVLRELVNELTEILAIIYQKLPSLMGKYQRAGGKKAKEILNFCKVESKIKKISH